MSLHLPSPKARPTRSSLGQVALQFREHSSLASTVVIRHFRLLLQLEEAVAPGMTRPELQVDQEAVAEGTGQRLGQVVREQPVRVTQEAVPALAGLQIIGLVEAEVALVQLAKTATQPRAHLALAVAAFPQALQGLLLQGAAAGAAA